MIWNCFTWRAQAKIDQHPVERQGRELARLELRHRDVLMMAAFGLILGFAS